MDSWIENLFMKCEIFEEKYVKSNYWIKHQISKYQVFIYEKVEPGG